VWFQRRGLTEGQQEEEATHVPQPRQKRTKHLRPSPSRTGQENQMNIALQLWAVECGTRVKKQSTKACCRVPRKLAKLRCMRSELVGGRGQRTSTSLVKGKKKKLPRCQKKKLQFRRFHYCPGNSNAMEKNPGKKGGEKRNIVQRLHTIKKGCFPQSRGSEIKRKELS